jgi:hypothetical protein
MLYCCIASWHQLGADRLTVEIIFRRSLFIHVKCVCKKGFILLKDVYVLCHFYFSDLKLLVDKLFCNEITTKNSEKDCIPFTWPWLTKQSFIQQFYTVYSRLQDILPL